MVNQLVKPHRLPDEYPAIAEFPDLGLEPDKSIDDYYGALVQLLRKIRQAGFGDDMPSESEDGDEDSDGGGADPHGDSGEQPKLNAGDRKASQVRAAWARLGVWWRAVPSGPAAQAPQSATAPARFLGDETGRGDHGGWRDGKRRRLGGRPLRRWDQGAKAAAAACGRGHLWLDRPENASGVFCGDPGHLEGRGGGTEFEPVFKWMREQRPFDGMLCLTDGYGPAPSSRPNCKLLWVIHEGGSPEVLPFGPTVRLPEARGTQRDG